jgi:malate dehydrogenase (quinone)
MFNHLNELEGVSIHFNHEVRTLKQRKDKTWRIKITDLATAKGKVYTKFVFIGAGGGSLPLLEADVPEGKGFGGFPVSGQWLKCINPDVMQAPIKNIQWLWWGTAYVSSHIDSRMINGENSCCLALCWFSTRFLKMDPIQTCLYP